MISPTRDQRHETKPQIIIEIADFFTNCGFLIARPDQLTYDYQYTFLF